ncbi:MAG: LysR family transcriptional regulator [Alphaproteobacteria bacterium]|nr:MAG: LysR family transcriptional regulator [Alphaproteobacteria bacterium]
MNLDRIRFFLEVARLKNFSGAARGLGLSPAAVSKQVQLLEDELGVKLLHRTTRQVTLTEAGQAFFMRANTAFTELGEAIEQAGEQQNAARGLLRVSVPVTFGHMYMLPLLASFAEAYPEITLEASFDDRMVDVLAEGFDVVIRIGPMHDSTMVMKPLGLSPLVLVAAPGYLKTRGTPRLSADLKTHRLLGYTHHGGAFEWHYQTPDGAAGHVRAECAMRTNSASMMLAAAVQGQGIALLPKFALGGTLLNGELVQVLPDHVTVPLRQVVALTPSARHRSAKVQAFMKHLATLPKLA